MFRIVMYRRLRSFTARQISRIREMMTKFRGNENRIFRWGGDFNGRKDPMHFEVIASTADVRDFVADWKAGKIDLSFDAPIAQEEAKPPLDHKPLISLKAVQAGIKNGTELVEGLDGSQYQTTLNWYTGFELVPDGVLGRNTRVVTAQAQLKVAKKNGANLTVDDTWPNAGFNSDLDGIPGKELFKALGIDNSDGIQAAR